MVSQKGRVRPKRFSFVYEKADPDEVSEYYKNNFLPIHFAARVPNNWISNEHHQIGFGDWEIWSCLCQSGMTLTYKDVPDSGNHVLYTARSGNMQMQVGQSTYTSSNECHFVGKIDHFDRIVLDPGRSHFAMSFTPATISRQLTEMLDDAVVKDITFQENIRLESPKAAQLARAVEFAGQYLGHDELVISADFYRHFLNALTALLLETVPNNFSERLARRVSPAVPRHLKRAIDYMQAHADQPLTVVDIAKAAETSVRALQGAFQQFRDTSPLNYLRTIRLNTVREKLRDPDCQSVAEAARSCGFTHLGRFSILYFEAFGEKPSDTLRNK